MPARRRRPSGFCSTPASRTRSARSTRAPPSWTGWSRSRNAGSRSLPPPPSASGRAHHPDHRHARPRRLHRRGRAVVARARRRGRGLRRCRRCGAADRERLAPGRQVPRAADVLRQQAGPHRRGLLPVRRHDGDPAQRDPVGAADSDRPRRRPHRCRRPDWHARAHLARRDHRRARTTRSRRSRRICSSRPPSSARSSSRRWPMSTTPLWSVPRRRGLAKRSSRPVSAGPRSPARRNPVLCGSAFKNKGVQPMLDAVVDFLPSPLDVPAIEGTATDGETPLQRHAVGRASRSPVWPSRSRPTSTSAS